MRILNFAPLVLALGALSCHNVACGIEMVLPDPPAGSYTVATFATSVDGEEKSVAGARVSQAFFEGPGVRPMLGRLFVPPEYSPGATAVVVISNDYWKTRFAGSPEVIGTPIQLNGRPAVIVGVAPPGFDFPDKARLWVPDVK